MNHQANGIWTNGQAIVVKYHADATYPLQPRYQAMADEIDRAILSYLPDPVELIQFAIDRLDFPNVGGRIDQGIIYRGG